MSFPRGHIDKPGQYEHSAFVLAETATRMGHPVDDPTRHAWGGMMAGLVDVDLRSEIASAQMPENGAHVAAMLGIDEPSVTPQVAGACKEMFEAMVATPRATTIDGHYTARRAESDRVVGVLRSLSRPELAGRRHLWGQLGAIAAVGIFTDSLVDAREDAASLPFSERQLVFGAMRYALRAALEIRPSTWRALLPAAHAEGLNFSIVRKVSVFAATRLWRLPLQQPSHPG
jgi:hypothetical protein